MGRAIYDGLMLGFNHKTLLLKYLDKTSPKPKHGYHNIHGFLLE